MTALAVALAALAGWLFVAPARESRIRGLGDAEAAARPALQRLRAAARAAVARVGIGPASRRRRTAQRLRVVQALAALAAELEAGQPPGAALRHAAGDPSVWPTAVAATRMGGDVVAALVEDSTTSPVLRQLAACWQVGVDSGAGLGAAVTRLAASVRADEDVRVQLEAQLAGPRASARMLGTLPLVGLAFGAMLGADPLGWLVGSPIGLACLVAGVVLSVLGTWWTGRIAARVEALL